MPILRLLFTWLSEEQINVYTKCIIDKIYNDYSIREPGSVYFGGGTPSLLGAENLRAHSEGGPNLLGAFMRGRRSRWRSIPAGMGLLF